MYRWCMVSAGLIRMAAERAPFPRAAAGTKTALCATKNARTATMVTLLLSHWNLVFFFVLNSNFGFKFFFLLEPKNRRGPRLLGEV